ncbi:acid-sensing ion channel 1-like [Littorina saxatilis]|uniref:Uncharacterized protein n=1 Tax=Littorina saxatilis TaxID=31220 RepID=A0AAN9B727_9CAEN
MSSNYGHNGNGWGAANGGYDRGPPMSSSRRNQRYDGDDHFRDTYGRQSPQKSNFSMEDSGIESMRGSDAYKGKGGSSNFSSPYRPDDRQDTSSEQPGSKRKAVARIFSRFAENCSMQGPPYLRASTWWLSRLLWSLMFIGALGAMTFHLYYLCQTYFAWPVQNKIVLGWSGLQFPAVTVCNVNPVRLARLGDLSDDFRQLVSLTDPANLGSIIDRLPARATGKRRRRQVTVLPTDLASDGDGDGDEENRPQLDDIDFDIPTNNFTNSRQELDDDFLDRSLDGYENSWEREAPESNFAQIERQFRELYAAERRVTRIQAGHQMRDMLVSCSFGGKTCYPNNFTLQTSMTYGNCYTLQYDKFVSRQSGPSGGMELIFYLDREEYIRGVTPDDGLQVTVHQAGTKPFPYDEGIAVSSGTHTMLSLKLMQIERYGKPYSKCANNSEFFNKYKVHYTRQTCQKLCEQEAIHTRCNCRDEVEEDLNILMAANDIKPCRSQSDIQCLSQTQWDYAQGRVECSCESPCLEYKYEKTMSSRPWPHKTFAKGVLVKTVCKRETGAKCASLTNKDNDDLTNEFVKLNIFYEDLNYENITESPDYEDVQFISDLGGTMGLWIGLSILSVAEVFQLFVELFRYLLCCRWRERVPKSS